MVDRLCRRDQLARPSRKAVVGAIFGEHWPDAEDDAALGDDLVELTHAREQLLAIARRYLASQGFVAMRSVWTS